MVATAVGISRKDIYRQPKLPEKDRVLVEAIKEAFTLHPAYGQYKIALHLKVNHKRAERVMKENGLKAPRRKTKYFCTVSTYHHTYTNLIKEILESEFVPHLIWVCDVSYFKFKGEMWYLATIEDLATRQILSSQIGKHHDANLIISTIKQAIQLTDYLPKYFHTDQGKEFMAKVVTDYLELQGVKVSVSAKASPWQNGYKESFFGHFKDEFGEINRFDSVGLLIEEIYSQIHYYNFDRIHRSLKMSPVQFATLHFPEYCLHKRGA
ncbi:IS3 family transposase [Patescibacteria group bacterium]|nr:IS3 family transposase [Patescibacteria group bacterium]MBU1966967.1 IS3 family transposase [Patescibacteria group bacterium]